MTTLIDRFPASQLGQLRPANTTAASVYAPASHYRTEIIEIFISNTTGSSADYRLFHDEDGTTYDETTALVFDTAVAANSTAILNTKIWMNGASGGNLGVRTSTNSALTFTVYGVEEKIR